MTDAELKLKGVEALIERLGEVQAERFISLIMQSFVFQVPKVPSPNFKTLKKTRYLPSELDTGLKSRSLPVSTFVLLLSIVAIL